MDLAHTTYPYGQSGKSAANDTSEPRSFEPADNPMKGEPTWERS
jgi:hypothetical protein